MVDPKSADALAVQRFYDEDEGNRTEHEFMHAAKGWGWDKSRCIHALESLGTEDEDILGALGMEDEAIALLKQAGWSGERIYAAFTPERWSNEIDHRSREDHLELCERTGATPHPQDFLTDDEFERRNQERCDARRRDRGW